MKNINKKGFTLIEIMIVIVIISLLAVTLVPKLTWAQARARDASRTASLVAMRAVLTAYFDDYSEYPLNTHDATNNAWNWCLSEDSKGWLAVNSALEDYVEWWKTSFDPQKNALVANCGTAGSFSYNALSKNGSAKSAFVLAAQTETYQKSNTIYGSWTIQGDWSDDINDVVWSWSIFGINITIPQLKTANSDASVTIYTVTGG